MSITTQMGYNGSTVYTGPKGSQLVVNASKTAAAFKGANGTVAIAGQGPNGGKGFAIAGPKGIAGGSVSPNGIVRFGALGEQLNGILLRGNLCTGDFGFIARNRCGNVKTGSNLDINC